MYRVKPGRFYCLTYNAAIVRFPGPGRRQRYVREIIAIERSRGVEQTRASAIRLAVLLDGSPVPQAEWPAAYAQIARETQRMADLVLRCSLHIARRLAS